MLFAAEESIDFLRRNNNGRGIALREFVVGRLNLSHLLSAVRSPRSANENERQRLAVIFRKPKRAPFDRWQFEVRSRIANVQSLRSGFQHGLL